MSLQRKGEVQDFIAEYGHIIVDECHHLSAFSFEQILRRAKAKYVLGLTATPIRKDGHHPIIFMQCGPIRFSLSTKRAAASAPFGRTVLPRYTDFQPTTDVDTTTIHDFYSAITSDYLRNSLIVRDIRSAVIAGRSPLVLTGRTEHLNSLFEAVRDIAPHVFALRGGMGRRQRKEIYDGIAAVPPSEPRIILSTGSYIGEGFDDSRLDTLFLAMPISWKGTLQQYVGRLHRLHDSKKEVQVFDYVDANVPMFTRMFKKRLAGYQALGYSVSEEQPNIWANTRGSVEDMENGSGTNEELRERHRSFGRTRNSSHAAIQVARSNGGRRK